VNPSDLSERFKEGAQLRFRRLKIHVPDKHVLHNFLSFQEWESAERAASMAGFRSLDGDGEDRMKSRGVVIPNTPEGEGNPRLPYKTQQLYQSLLAFPLEFPDAGAANNLEALLSQVRPFQSAVISDTGQHSC
jgi:hypothetical protein